MVPNRKGGLPAVLIAPLLVLMLGPGLAQAQGASPGAKGAITGIELTFRRDLRDVDAFRGGGVWGTAPGYNGVAAQDTVEIRAEGASASGRPARISPEWATSDPQMVTVSPGKGDDVKVTVHRPGESKLKITYQGVSKELVVTAQKTGALLVFQMAPPAPSKPSGPAAEQMNPALKTAQAQFSYAAGMRLAKTLRAQSVEVDPELVSQAMKDVLAGGAVLMSEAQEQTALMGVETELNVTQAVVERKKVAETNRQASEQFLAQNKKKEGVVSLPSGLQYKVLKAGDGKRVTGLDAAVCQYKGTLIDGTEFDNSYKRKDGGPVTFPLKAVIKGWRSMWNCCRSENRARRPRRRTRRTSRC